MIRALAWFSVLMPLTACHRSDAAPEDMDGLVRFMFDNFEDPDMMKEGMSNLAVWLDTDGRSEEASDKGLLLADLTPEVVDGVNHPDEDLTRCVGVAVAGASPYPVLDHAALIALEDQTWNDDSYATYARSFVDGDLDSFATGLGLLRTDNDIVKNGPFGVKIPYLLKKDFQWVPLDDEQSAVVARSWIEELSCGDGGDNCLHQSFSIDLWFGVSGEETLRMTAAWNDLVTVADAALTEQQRVGVMVKGVNDIYESTDALLDAQQ